MIGQSVTPRITIRLGASSSQAKRASCCLSERGLEKKRERVVMSKNRGWICAAAQIQPLSSRYRLFTGELDPLGGGRVQGVLGGLGARQGFLDGQLQRSGGLVVVGHRRALVGEGELRQESRHRDRVARRGGF